MEAKTKIKIVVDKKQSLELTIEEARELRDLLDQVAGEKKVYYPDTPPVVYPLYPGTPYWDRAAAPLPPYEITWC